MLSSDVRVENVVGVLIDVQVMLEKLVSWGCNVAHAASSIIVLSLFYNPPDEKVRFFSCLVSGP